MNEANNSVKYTPYKYTHTCTHGAAKVHMHRIDSRTWVSVKSSLDARHIRFDTDRYLDLSNSNSNAWICSNEKAVRDLFFEWKAVDAFRSGVVSVAKIERIYIRHEVIMRKGPEVTLGETYSSEVSSKTQRPQPILSVCMCMLCGERCNCVHNFLRLFSSLSFDHSLFFDRYSFLRSVLFTLSCNDRPAIGKILRQTSRISPP